MPFIGNQPALSYTSFAKQDFTTSATTSYTLDNPVANANELALFINFVRQEPTTAYSASGTSLTLTSATSASDDMYCVFLGKAVQTVNPPNGSVDSSKINYPLTTFSSTGIDDNATSTAITIDSSENVTVTGSITFADGHFLGNGAGDNLDIISGTGENIIYKSDGGIHAFQDNSGTERMRIDSSGNVLISGTTYDQDAQDLAVGMCAIGADGRINIHSNVQPLELARTVGDTASRAHVQFWREGSSVGGINTTGSATSYSTSSDHRLKENVNYNFDATTRLKQLKPARFNFITDADITVDGFLAHEVSSVVPEAITGTHNEVEVWKEGEELPEGVSVGDNKLDENGNTIPVYQGIDQSKLVPLLVKTIQELEARITTLENA
jgi:hypothetical protein